MKHRLQLDRIDLLTMVASEALEEHHATLDEAVNVAATLIGWSLHRANGSLDYKLEALTTIAREVRGLLIRNHGRAER